MVSAEAIKQKLREAEQSEPARNAPVVSAIKRPAVQSSDTKAPSRPPSQRRGEKSAGRRTKPKELSHKRRQPVPSAPAYVKPTATPRQLLNLAARSRNARLSLTPSQTSAVTRTSFLVRNRLTGVDPVQTEDALVRTITAFQHPAAGTTFRDQLVSELRRCYEAGTAQRTADRVLAVAPLDKLISAATSAEGGELVEVPVETASAVPHEVLSPANSPRPRLPRTSMRAFVLISVRTWAGRPRLTMVRSASGGCPWKASATADFRILVASTWGRD